MRQVLNATRVIYKRKFDRRHDRRDDEEEFLNARRRDEYIYEMKSHLHHQKIYTIDALLVQIVRFDLRFKLNPLRRRQVVRFDLRFKLNDLHDCDS